MSRSDTRAMGRFSRSCMVRFSATCFIRMSTYIFVGNGPNATSGVFPAKGAILPSNLGGILAWYFFIGNGEMRFLRFPESFGLVRYS